MLLFSIYPALLCFIFTTRMTSILGHKHPYKERISEDFLGSSPPLESNYDKASVDFLAIDSSEPLIAKYTKRSIKNPQNDPRSPSTLL